MLYTELRNLKLFQSKFLTHFVFHACIGNKWFSLSFYRSGPDMNYFWNGLVGSAQSQNFRFSYRHWGYGLPTFFFFFMPEVYGRKRPNSLGLCVGMGGSVQTKNLRRGNFTSKKMHNNIKNKSGLILIVTRNFGIKKKMHIYL